MVLIRNEKRFLYVTTGVLVALFFITLVQNFIRYKHHDSYSIWVSVLYLCFSVLFFIPFAVLSLKTQIRLQQKFPTLFWWLILPLSLVFLFSFYLVSNVILHGLGYFDYFIDEEYARYYFGREALYHLLLLIGSAVYVHFTQRRSRTVDVFKGRKKITLEIKQVDWIEADGHYVHFYVGKDTYLKREKLGTLAHTLGSDFIRIHRKYIVNRNQINSKEKNGRDEFLILNSGVRLKIGNSYKPIVW